jgi:hypothetical protein
VDDVVEKMEAQKQELLTKFDGLPEILSAHFRNTMEINGAVSATQSDVRRIINETMESFSQRFILPSPPAAAPAISSSDIQRRGPFFESEWTLYQWSDDSRQYFPENFNFAGNYCTSFLWDRWYFGEAGGQAPYRKLVAKHISGQGKTTKQIATQKSYISKASGIMKELVTILIASGSITKASNLYSMSYEVSRTKFSDSFLVFAKRVYGIEDEAILDNMRIGDIKFTSLYDNWKKPSRRKRGRGGRESDEDED